MTERLPTADKLKAHLKVKPASTLIHVLPAEIFAAQRIPGSRNACVYEVAFLSQVEAIAPDKRHSLVLYGAGKESQDAAVAAAKLEEAGYQNLAVYEGGLADWAASGEALESDASLPAESVLDGEFRADLATSVVRWTGRNLFNHHNGTVKLAGGDLGFRAGHLVAGRFEIDLRTIACEDITDPAANSMLLQHLSSADFFLVDQHPTATFVLRNADPIEGSTAGTPNWLATGDFTLRGVTRPLTFPVVLAAANGTQLTAQAQLELDRTPFGSIYGSGRFFQFLGKHVVNDHIHLHVKLHAAKVA